jgi:TRAP-type C4-dicarboxylate transport system substrate-binding protein
LRSVNNSGAGTLPAITRQFPGKFLKVISFCVTCFLVASSLAANERQYEFHLACTSGDKDSPQGSSSLLFAERVATNSDGRIIINVFFQNELGGQNELFDQLLKGNVHFMLEAPMTAYDQRLAIGFVPYLVLNWEDAIDAFGPDGWLNQLMSPLFAENGLKFFGPYPEGFGGIATRGRYATNPDSARGIKVRSQTIFPNPQTVQAMGFEVVPIDWSEVYTSIQTGIVDGDSGNVIYWDYEYFGDILDYYVHSRQSFAFSVLMMNLDAWTDMPAEDQRIVEEAAQWMIQKQFANARATDEYWIRTAQENGMEYLVPSHEEMAQWVQRVREQVWPLAAEAYGEEIMAVMRANASSPE